MLVKIYDLYYDFKTNQKRIPTPITVAQYDNLGVEIRLHITDGGVPASTSGTTALFVTQKSDGYTSAAMNVGVGYYSKLFVTGETQDSGDRRAAIEIYGANAERLSVIDFELLVVQSPRRGQEVTPQQAQTVLQDLLDAADAANAAADRVPEDINAALAGKVDKIPGKGLSTNDYTDEDKAKLTSITGGANVQTSTATINDLTVNITYIKSDSRAIVYIADMVPTGTGGSTITLPAELQGYTNLSGRSAGGYGGGTVWQTGNPKNIYLIGNDADGKTLNIMGQGAMPVTVANYMIVEAWCVLNYGA
ncbi:MAG: hypothetical protein KH354_03570 [Clostridiales bacterium]|nr:hypothetical protein [Clostridiales bacterium]